MARTPFVWEVQVRREVLEDEMERLRELPYSLWRDVLRSPLTRTAVGRDGRTYRLHVTANWAAPGSDDIRVSIALKSTLGRSLLADSFVITPDNWFVD